MLIEVILWPNNEAHQIITASKSDGDKSIKVLATIQDGSSAYGVYY